MNEILTPFNVEEYLTPRLLQGPRDGVELGDNADTHRWRAFWEHAWNEGEPTHILLRPYRVIRKTPYGAWIDPDSHGHLIAGVWEWNTENQPQKPRWVSNNGAQAWAKPTREEALISITIRLCRWSQLLRSNAEKAMKSAKAIETLFPERAWAADEVRTQLSGLGTRPA